MDPVPLGPKARFGARRIRWKTISEQCGTVFHGLDSGCRRVSRRCSKYLEVQEVVINGVLSSIVAAIIRIILELLKLIDYSPDYNI